ncbi:MAG: hypothetical protein KDA78_03510, partial [Planctomycetaceae bacterium]|nr:hypothetical protein [Planctomycetaceae bacterium]
RDHPIQLCHAQTSPGNSQNQQWKNCLIRGQDWAPLQIATDRLKLRVEGVAAFLGGNPFLDLGLATGNSGGRPGSSRPIQDVDRDLAFSDLVVVNRGTQVTITNLNSRIDPPQTQFRLNRCTFVSQGAATVPFLMISNWPENVLAQESEGQLSRLRWVTENSSFCGWKTRSVATTNKTRASFTVENDDQWKTFWGNVGLFGNWDDKTLNPLSATQLVSFTGNELQRMGLTAVSRPEEITLSAMENLPVPPLTRQSWRAELAAQQKFPSPVASPFNKSTPRVSVNLNDPKVDLGQYLSSTNLPDPVVVEVKGFGLRTSDRIRLENRRVKLEFQSEPNKFPLTLRPKLTSTGNQSGPWISVTGGYLEISSGVFNVDPVVDSAMPSQWVKSQGASVLLNQCYVTAAEQPQEKLAALIDVDSAPAPTADFSSLSLQQSYLQYGGDLLRINLKSCRPFVNQSVLVTQRHALALSYKGEGAAKRGFFQLTHSTVSSRAGHFQFEIPQPEPHRPPLVEGVIRDNVFAGAVGVEDKSAPKPQLLVAKPSLDDLPGRIWWWGERNGFSNELTQNLQNKPLSDQWTTYWGRGHVQEPLFGADGVMLADNLSQLKQFRPSSFRLFREARARTWGPNQTLIGADCEKLDLAEYDATKATPPNTNPNQNQPKPVVPKI